MSRIVFCQLCLLLALCVETVSGQLNVPDDRISKPSASYDPLKIDKQKIEQLELTVHDSGRTRDIPIRVYLPSANDKAPVILFSHGLGGSRNNSPYLGNHWAGRGFVAVFLQHPGSDESVWKDVRLGQRLAAMRQAASNENLLLRMKDVPAVIDQLEKWNAELEHPLNGRMDLEAIGMTGHSFGAITTQLISGQLYLGNTKSTDLRIKAALPMSPSVPKLGNPNRSFAQVKIPWLLMTGTHDTSMINNTTVEDRLAVFPALPAGDKYQLVLNKAEHSAFGDRALPGEREVRNPNHHRAILAISTAFWEAYLKKDDSAKAWLQSEDVRKVLEPQDEWKKK
jgi:predicted dienelactone hydrolase